LDGENTFTDLFKGMEYLTVGAVVISIFSALILLLFSSGVIESSKWGKLVPATLITVVLATIFNHFLPQFSAYFELDAEHMVSVPKGKEVLKISFPNFLAFSNQLVWIWGGKNCYCRFFGIAFIH
jgi:hypothetical protein